MTNVVPYGYPLSGTGMPKKWHTDGTRPRRSLFRPIAKGFLNILGTTPDRTQNIPPRPLLARQTNPLPGPMRCPPHASPTPLPCPKTPPSLSSRTLRRAGNQAQTIPFPRNTSPAASPQSPELPCKALHPTPGWGAVVAAQATPLLPGVPMPSRTPRPQVRGAEPIFWAFGGGLILDRRQGGPVP